MSYRIADLQDDSAILPVLEQDRRWAAYALCDLEQPYRANARFIGATKDGHTRAVALLYALPSFTALCTALCPCGDTEAIRALMAGTNDLPESILMMVRDADLPGLEQRYRVDRAWTMLRMTVEPEGLRPVSAVDAEVRRLVGADTPTLRDLYAHHAASVFEPSMLEHGIYYGAFRAGTLVAVAGTHAMARRHGIATIGGVVTQPDHRGRGLARATTSAVARALAADGIRTIALNVAEDNAPAIAVYRNLGFNAHTPFWEGYATLR